jgi:hypothetical protein
MSYTANENPVTVSLLKDAFRAAMAAKRPLMIWGAPGLGKSEAVEQIAIEQDRPLIDLRLLLMEPTDLRGIPFKTTMEQLDPETGELVNVDTVRWAPPEELPRPGFKENAILFLDELPSASPVVQAASYQLILNRRIGSYVLPDGVDIVAAGNRQSDKGVSYRMPTPLANRFLHCTLVFDFDEWKQWAISSGKVHADVIAFHVESGGKDVFTFNPKENKETAFATPRTWVFASDVIANPETSKAVQRVLVAGSVGEALANEFFEFRRIHEQLPRTEDILAGKVTKHDGFKDMSAKYLVIINLCHALKNYFDAHNVTRAQDEHLAKVKDNLIPMCDNFVNFIIDNFEDELTILGLRTALHDYKLPMPYHQMATFKRFTGKYKKFII